MHILRKRTPARKNRLPVRRLHRLLIRALRIITRVRQRENNRVFVPLCHFLKQRLREDASDRGEAHEDGGFDVFHYFGQGFELATLVVVAREVGFMGRESVAAVVSYEALGVDEPEAAAGFVFREAFFDEVLDDLFRDAYTCTSGSHEDCSLVFDCAAGFAEGADDTC